MGAYDNANIHYYSILTLTSKTYLYFYKIVPEIFSLFLKYIRDYHIFLNK